VAAANALGAAIDDRVARATIGVSEATLRGNGLASGGSISVIPNLLPDAVRADAEATDIPALPREPYLLFVGDLRAHKGLDVLLAAYRRLVDPPPLVLVGEIQGAAVSGFPPGVITVGAVPNAAVATAWSRALVGIVPSIWPEPFGIVVLEAMTAGCPVVASAIGGIPEIITDDVDGVLVPPSDPAALAGALTALLADDERRARLGRAALVTSERYRSDVVAAEAEGVYEQALAARRR
jgi:glycosyltransferase involved in cell wall biosynthesis